MAKLVVSEFDHIVDNEEKKFCRIIARILHYDFAKGIFTVESIYDRSRCELHIEMETDTEHWKAIPALIEGDVVEIEAVKFLNDGTNSLKCQMIESVKLPGTLFKESETILAFSKLK